MSGRKMSAEGLAKRLLSETDERKRAVRQLLMEHSVEELEQLRSDAGAKLAQAKKRFAELSHAIALAHSAESLRQQWAGATDEEREALAFLTT